MPGPMTTDEVLTTTRAVRKRLDLTRPVERSVLEECLAIAQQAPSGRNRQGWGFVVVTDPAKRLALAELYRRGWEQYRAGTQSRAQTPPESPLERVLDSADYLAEHLHEVPVHLIPCIRGRTENQPIVTQAGVWGSILPAVWSFMLAARARPRHRLDHRPSPIRRGSRRYPRHPLPRSHAGRARPGRLHDRHRV